MIQGSPEARNEKQLKEDSRGPSTLIKSRVLQMLYKNMICQIMLDITSHHLSGFFPPEPEFQSRSLCLEKEEEWSQTASMLMNQSFFTGGTEDRCRHWPRTIVLEAMQSSAPSNGAAPAAVAKKNGNNGHHSKLSGKTKYYHCQLSIKFQISQIHRNLQCTSQFCPSGSISGFQCAIDCLVVAEHGRLALTRLGSYPS